MSVALSGVELGESEDLAVLIDACLTTGAKGVELWRPKNLPLDASQHVLSRLRNAGLDVVCVSAGIELFRDKGSDKQQAELLDLIEFAALGGIERTNTYFGFSSLRDDTRAIEGYLHWVGPCIERAEALGVTILIENEFDAFGWDPAASDVTRRPEALRRLLDHAGSPRFGLTFDAANFLCADADVLCAFDVLASHVRYMHVKDVHRAPSKSARDGFRLYTDYDRSYSTCFLGEGEVPWPALIARAKAAGFGGPFCLEPHATSLREAAWTQSARQLQSWLSGAPARGHG